MNPLNNLALRRRVPPKEKNEKTPNKTNKRGHTHQKKLSKQGVKKLPKHPGEGQTWFDGWNGC